MRLSFEMPLHHTRKKYEEAHATVEKEASFQKLEDLFKKIHIQTKYIYKNESLPENTAEEIQILEFEKSDLELYYKTIHEKIKTAEKEIPQYIEDSYIPEKYRNTKESPMLYDPISKKFTLGAETLTFGQILADIPYGKFYVLPDPTDRFLKKCHTEYLEEYFLYRYVEISNRQIALREGCTTAPKDANKNLAYKELFEEYISSKETLFKEYENPEKLGHYAENIFASFLKMAHGDTGLSARAFIPDWDNDVDWKVDLVVLFEKENDPDLLERERLFLQLHTTDTPSSEHTSLQLTTSTHEETLKKKESQISRQREKLREKGITDAHYALLSLDKKMLKGAIAQWLQNPCVGGPAVYFTEKDTCMLLEKLEDARKKSIL